MYIFNPQCDMCLAAGKTDINLNSRLRDFVVRNSLLPALYAPSGSSILCLHADPSTLPFYDIAVKRGIGIVREDDIAEDDFVPVPWGWCLQLRHYLADKGIGKDVLPADEELESLRKLSHRRTSIMFYRDAHRFGHFLDIPEPMEFLSAQDALEFIKERPNFRFLKFPWSSSGRGVFDLAKVGESKARQIMESAIRKQGSLILEKRYDKTLDFATEWHVCGGEVSFIGFSVFGASPDGTYEGNMIAPQDALQGVIPSHCKEPDLLEALAIQKQVLLKEVAGSYSGPLGIDMLADAEGRIIPCVEINFRTTMGHVAIWAAEYTRLSHIRIS